MVLGSLKPTLDLKVPDKLLLGADDLPHMFSSSTVHLLNQIGDKRHKKAPTKCLSWGSIGLVNSLERVIHPEEVVTTKVLNRSCLRFVTKVRAVCFIS